MPKYDKVSTATPADLSPPTSARWINSVSEAAEWYEKNIRMGVDKGFPGGGESLVKVQNKTGADLNQGSVVELGEHLLDEIDRQNFWFEGNEYDDGVLAILIEPLKDDFIGSAQVDGPCVALVNVTNLTHQYAAPAAGDTVLQSGESGPVRILSKSYTLWAGGAYATGVTVKIPIAADFAETSFYSATNLVVQGGLLYQAIGSVSAGVFDDDDWTAVGAPGARYTSNTAVDAGPWVPSEWGLGGDTPTTGEHECVVLLGSTSAGAVEDDDRRSCVEAVALNFTGRPVEPGHVMYVEGDATELDMTQLYPVKTGGDIEVVYINTAFHTTTATVNVDLSRGGLNDDDLVVLISTYNVGNNEGLTSAFYDSFAYSPTMVDGGGVGLPGIVALWYNQLSAGVLPVDSASAFSCRGILLVLRGVKRWPTDGVTLTPGFIRGLVVYGLPSFIYTFQDTHNQAQPAAAMTTGTNGRALRGTTYNSLNSLGLSASSHDTTYVFPIGTRFLMAHQVRGAISGSGTHQMRSGDWTPSDDADFVAESISGAESAPNSMKLATYLTPPLTAPAAAVPSAMLAKFATEDVRTGVDGLAVIPLMPTAEDPAVFPAIPCDPLICTEYLRAAPLTANTPLAKRTARQQLDKAKRRNIVFVKEATLALYDSGTVVRDGYFKPWIYRRNLTDRYAGPPPENFDRTLIYDSPLSGEVGKLGRAYRSAVAKRAATIANAAAGIDDLDPRIECFAWRPDILVSCAEPGPVEVIKWGHDDYAQPDEITVTITATKTTAAGTAATGTWDNWTLSTGSDVDTTQVWNISSVPAEVLLNLGTFLLIDLTTDAPGLTKPVYGDPRQTFQTVTSASGKFIATLIYNRRLFIYPVWELWTEFDISDPQTDTFTFTDDAITFEPPNFAPMMYVNPETGEFGTVVESDPGVGEITYAAWPEEWPEPDSQVPTGTDIVDVPAGFDPYLGRVPGSVEGLEEFDYRTGLQLALVKFRDVSPGGGGGCC